MKKTEAMMLQGASENKTYYQRFFEKLAEDFSRPGAKATSYEEHRNIESRVLQRLQNIYWMKNFTTATNTSVEEVITLSNYSIKRSDWDKKLNAHFNVTPGGFDAYSFTIYNTEFFGAFFQLLSSDNETAIAYYVGWCIVQVVSQLATKELIRYSYTNDYEAITGHEYLCSTMTLNYFGLPFYAGYMSGYMRPPLTISRAHKIFKNAKATFGTALERSDFKKFFAPLSRMSIGSETSIVELVRKRNEYVLNSMYMRFPDMKQSIWSNIPEATHARRITELNETLLDYIDVDLQAVYRLRKQHVQLLPIAFEAPFYDDDTIAAANYGALGSEMASGLATLIITIMNMSANDTFAKLGSNSSCLATSQLTSTAASHPMSEKNDLELLVRSTALRMTYYAYFAGDRDWRDYRLSGYTQLTDKKLLFIFWCILQCGKPDAKFKCNGPVEAFKSFGTAFGCSPGDPMHSGRDCVALI
ncbi:hypothetical protein HPB48_011009 [Haemaphysalis longicornis]|uniref:Uncharacterized protein n=1 Tax=Haemaphysalis longicornis TaxID=44386 RepID=A0A9J6GNM4_HAELO|nr:hypothetical protein HPB48_011009 [Haemaphysalis longicornis]